MSTTAVFLSFFVLFLIFAATEATGRHDLFYLPLHDEDDK